MMRPIRLLALMMVVALAGGCFLFSPKYVIPEMATAREQYDVAYTTYRKAEGMVPSAEGRDGALKEARAAFCKVQEFFPSDETYTPRAVIMQARCDLMRQRFSAAEREYRRALDMYPGNREVLSLGLYELGITLEKNKKYAESKEVLRQFLEKFSADEDPVVKQHVEDARARYKQIHKE